MFRFLAMLLCGLVVGVSAHANAGPPHDPTIVGDSTGAFRKELEGTWVRGNPNAPDRLELCFTWQRFGGGQEWSKRPALALYRYSDNQNVASEGGPIFLEKNGKKVLRYGGRTYEYTIKADAMEIKEYIPPVQFEDGKDESSDRPDRVIGKWKKLRPLPKEDEETEKAPMSPGKQ